MKLNNIIVSSIVDMRYIFKLYPLDVTLLDFWKNRHHFVRDFAPQNVVYWNSNVESWYTALKEWNIKDLTKEELTEKIINDGIHSLMSLCDIDSSHEALIRNILVNKTNTNNQVITVFAGENKTLVSKPCDQGASTHICLKKIEVVGSCDKYSTIFIDNDDEKVTFKNMNVTLRGGECIYAVYCNGVWLDLLPNHLECGDIKLKLINKPLEFSSILHINKTSKYYNSTENINNVVAIAFIDKTNFIYLDINNIIRGGIVPPSLRTFAFKPVLIKSNDVNSMVFAISADGKLKTSNSLDEINDVLYAEFTQGSVKPIK